MKWQAKQKTRCKLNSLSPPPAYASLAADARAAGCRAFSLASSYSVAKMKLR
jgi:hypothetical protein